MDSRGGGSSGDPIRDIDAHLANRLAIAGTMARCGRTRLDRCRATAGESGEIKGTRLDDMAGHGQPTGDSADAGIFLRDYRNLWLRDLVSDDLTAGHEPAKNAPDSARRLTPRCGPGCHV